MGYQIQDLQLIPQDRTNACWYAATKMLVTWRRNKMMMSEVGLRDPSEIQAAVDLHKSNNVLPWASMKKYAKMIGLVEIPLMCPDLNTLENWMRQFGPLWCDGVPVDWRGRPAGAGHVVVISGIRQKTKRTRNGVETINEVKIHDPWPINRGKVSWRPIDHLTLGIMSSGTNAIREVCLLRLP